MIFSGWRGVTNVLGKGCQKHEEKVSKMLKNTRGKCMYMVYICAGISYI